MLLVGVAPAAASLSDVPTPTVAGPIANTADSTPWTATDKPLGDYGYIEQEFKYSGDASQYDTTGAIDQTGTPITTGGPNNDGKYPFKTRMIVRRPADPADFNGTVVVEWLNVTAGFDLEANWFGDPEYLLKNGYAYVGITAQRVGVNWLRGWDPGRYGDLDVSARDNGGTETITNDALSYDVYGSGIKALLDGGTGVDPLGNLPKPDTVIASGESQSGSRLSTYYNKVQPIHDVVDAFLITVSTGALRDDGSAPAIRVLSENENRVPRTEPDSSNYRQWEVAGASHLPRMAFENFQKPVERDTGLTLSAGCVKYPLSRVQWPYVVNSAYRAPGRLGERRRRASDRPARRLPGRARRSRQPARAGRERHRPGRDPAARGLGAGSPEHRHQLRRSAGGGIFSAFCVLLGSSEDLSNAVLKNTYEDWGDYIDQVTAKAQEVADQGFILDEDVPRLIAQHEQVYTLRPTKPKRSGKKKPSDSKFKLRGRAAPPPTRRSSSSTPTTAATPGAPSRAPGDLAKPKFKINEKPGIWIYKVRSTTVVPADAARPSFTVTTPYSKRSTKAKVVR